MAEITSPALVGNLPSPVPQRGGSQPNFTARGNDFIAAMPTLVSQLNAAMQWLHDTAVAVESLGGDISTDVLAAMNDIESSKDAAITEIQRVMKQIEELSSQFQDHETEINAMKAAMLTEIENAKLAAVAEVQTACSGGSTA